MNYKEYLKSEAWNILRKEAYKRADYKCELCNASGVRINAHHTKYPKTYKEDNIDNLLVTCDKCHDLIGGYRVTEFEVLKAFLELEILIPRKVLLTIKTKTQLNNILKSFPQNGL